MQQVTKEDFLMTWSFSLKERVDDQDQWALARLTSPGVP